ncbi:MAG: hypothetical protein KGI38_12715, partial [Thaumarchaeota archaeon]|nr:hypothetical protein [Nitrososphaerota archaeon]
RHHQHNQYGPGKAALHIFLELYLKRCLNCWLRADEAEITLRDMVDDDECGDPEHQKPELVA